MDDNQYGRSDGNYHTAIHASNVSGQVQEYHDLWWRSSHLRQFVISRSVAGHDFRSGVAKAMIPHHSIAILTSERANIEDKRVRAGRWNHPDF